MSWILNTIAALAEGDEDEEREPREDEDESEDADEDSKKEPGHANLKATRSAPGSQRERRAGDGDDSEDNDDEEREEERDARDRERDLKDDLSELQRSLRSGLKGMTSFFTGEPNAPSVKAQPRAAPEESARAAAAAPAAASSASAEDSRKGSSVQEEDNGTDAMQTAGDAIKEGAGTSELGEDDGARQQQEARVAGLATSALTGREGDKQRPKNDGAEAGSPAAPKVKGMKDDLAELSSRVKSGLSHFSSVMRVVRGDDLVGHVDEAGDPTGKEKSPGGEPGEGGDTRGRGGAEGEEEDEEESAEEALAAAGEALLRAAQEDMKAISGTLASGISGFSSFAKGLLAAAKAEWQADEEDEGDGEGGKARSRGGGFLGFGGEDEESGVGGDSDDLKAVGLTEDVISFAHNISVHPETWIDFPLPDEDDEPEDFRPTAEQEEHMEAVELRVPRLVAVRLELTPSYMSEQRFWKIYFVLLHSHLPPSASAVLSTPQILAARALVLRQLQEAEQEKQQHEAASAPPASEAGHPPEPTAPEPEEPQAEAPVEAPAESPGLTDAAGPDAGASTANDGEQGSFIAPLPAAEDPVAAPVIAPVAPPATAIPTSAAKGGGHSTPAGPGAVGPAPAAAPAAVPAEAKEVDEEEADDWLNEEVGGEGVELVGGEGAGEEDEEEVSFSDLEEDEDDDAADDGDISKVGLTGPNAGPKPSAPTPAQAAAAQCTGVAGAGAGDKKKLGEGAGAGAEWVELKDNNSSGGSDNHSADWQTVEAEDLP